MAVTTAKIRKKIAAAQQMIDHPRTNEELRDTARRMIARLQAKLAELGEARVELPGYADTIVYGSKYAQAKGLTLTEIAKLIREDIKLARKVGLKVTEADASLPAVIDPIADMPAHITIAVRKRPRGSTIDIVLKGIPLDCASEWGYRWGRDRSNQEAWVPTPELEALVKELSAIHWAYNYDGSDLQAEIFNRRYYGSVQVEYDARGWTRPV